ncbi:MAG: hypothetical protein JSV88_18505 [Candidatus Aminicenantes bacterium]|nr:MAG: hypothetical protein JSV88_18505 [Candidatus Aminicenantes bacterium]
MNILDEQILENQRQLLRSWRIRVRQIGYDIGRKGLKDKEIIPLLLQFRKPTFFTLDFDFFESRLCHPKYAIVCMDVGKHEAAVYVRRLLCHPDFDTVAKRMGKVIRLSSMRAGVWRLHGEKEVFIDWPL